MTYSEVEIQKIKEKSDIELNEVMEEMLQTPIHKRRLVMCPICGDSPPKEKVKHLENQEKQNNTIIMKASVPCSQECKLIEKL